MVHLEFEIEELDFLKENILIFMLLNGYDFDPLELVSFVELPNFNIVDKTDCII